jgi:hypothetical protein
MNNVGVYQIQNLINGEPRLKMSESRKLYYLNKAQEKHNG